MTRQRSDEERKRQIRAAATRCFVRRGFAATRLLDIAREAGLSKGGVYFHYRAKEQLFQDILDAQLARLQERWSFEPVADQPAERVLARLVLAHVRTLEDEPDETRLGHLLVSMAPQDPVFRERLRESLEVMRGLYARIIRRGMDDGAFEAGDAEAVAASILALVQGLACQSAVDSDGRLGVAADVAASLAVRMAKGGLPTAASVAAVGRN
jgi:AcrR family transcriptional regulator